MSPVLMNIIYPQFAFSGSGSHCRQSSCFTKAGQEYSGIIPSPLSVPSLTQIIFRPASFSFKKKIQGNQNYGFSDSSSPCDCQGAVRDSCSLRDRDWDPSTKTWPAEQGQAAGTIPPPAGSGAALALGMDASLGMGTAVPSWGRD